MDWKEVGCMFVCLYVKIYRHIAIQRLEDFIGSIDFIQAKKLGFLHQLKIFSRFLPNSINDSNTNIFNCSQQVLVRYQISKINYNSLKARLF